MSSLSNGSHSKKPKGLYFLADQQLEKIYGPDTQAEISRRIDILPTVLTPALYKSSNKAWPEVEMIFSGWGMTATDEAFLARFPNLKMIFYAAGSIKAFVTEAFWRSGIRVTQASAANAVPVAEYTCAQIIQALKGCWQTALFIKREKKFPPYHAPPGVYQTTVGLLSLGKIGALVVEKLRNCDVKIVAYDPFVTPEQAESMNITLLSLDEVFRQSDVVSCHTPWLPETERMIRGRHFEMLKPESTFINTARGAVVAEEEMIEVLKRRPDLLAILDVTHPEPPVPDSALYTLDNVILTPHIAGSMGHECRRMGEYIADELDSYLAGKPLRFEVNEKLAAITA